MKVSHSSGALLAAALLLGAANGAQVPPAPTPRATDEDRSNRIRVHEERLKAIIEERRLRRVQHEKDLAAGLATPYPTPTPSPAATATPRPSFDDLRLERLHKQYNKFHTPRPTPTVDSEEAARKAARVRAHQKRIDQIIANRHIEAAERERLERADGDTSATATTAAAKPGS